MLLLLVKDRLDAAAGMAAAICLILKRVSVFGLMPSVFGLVI